MTSRPRFSRVACVLTALLAFAAAGAEDPPRQQVLPVIDLTFNGGTVIDYVAALRKATGDANIVVDPEAAQIPMPAISLRHVTVPAALEVLKGRTVNAGEFFVTQLDVAHVPSFSPEERPTYQVQARSGQNARNAGPVPITRVWAVSSLLGADLTSRKLLSAVETAVAVVGSTPKPDVRFHEDTGLMIARGNDGQISAIEQVIEQLDLALSQRQSNQIAALQRKLDECQKVQGQQPRPQMPEPKAGEQRPPGH